MIFLKVSGKNEIQVGKVVARVGLMTKAGPVTRVTDKSIWCQTSYGDRSYRAYDGRLPWVTKASAGDSIIEISINATRAV